MPTITVNGQSAEFSEDKRLTLAIKDLGVNIGHRCGGQARCTTCRVEFVSGEPGEMTRAEFLKLGYGTIGQEPGSVPTYRLSCQIRCSQDMVVEALMTLEDQNWQDTGPELDEEVEPEAMWFSKEELVQTAE